MEPSRSRYPNFDEPAAVAQELSVLVFPPAVYGGVVVRLTAQATDPGGSSRDALTFLREHHAGQAAVADEISELNVWALDRGFAQAAPGWTPSVTGTWYVLFARLVPGGRHPRVTT